MTLKEHKKHADIAKPKGGKFHQNELSILGAPCGMIQKLAAKINQSLPNLLIAYADADHGESKDQPQFHGQYTDKIGFHEVQFYSNYMDYEYRQHLASADFAIINGNHFKAAHQLVMINAKKAESLQRKLDRLTNVQAFILDEGMEQPFEFLYDHNPDWKSLPIFKIEDLKSISDFVGNWYTTQIPSLMGLVLAGGKSTRMGQDKSKIAYHDKPHAIHLADLLNACCKETYLSKANTEDSMDGYEVIADVFLDLGPLSGILSAFRKNPNAAWLTIATDVPLVNEETIQRLIRERDPSRFATCFHNPETNFPEPLITIWEPRAYPRILQFLATGYTCPRKALINSDIKEVHLNNHEVLANANTPEEMESLKAKIIHG